MFKTNLFKLLNSGAAKVFIDGYEIETIQDCGIDANGDAVMRCECDDDNDWYFADQEVVVQAGECKAMTAPGDWDTGGEPFEAVLEFFVTRPIEEDDL